MNKDRTIQIIGHIVMFIITVCILLPLFILIGSSLTDNLTLIQCGYNVFPRKFSLDAYEYIFNSKESIFRSYGISIVLVMVGTTVSLCLSLPLAYAISRPGLTLKGPLIFYVFFTMLFNGGLVPTYMMWTQSFHIKNTLWALIIPGLLMNGFYIIMMRSFFQANIPDALIEAARIDGGGEYRILFQVVTPLSKPIMATMALMIGLGYWNDWMNSLYYITDDKLFSIQAILNTIITNIQFLTSGQSSAASSVNVANLPSIVIRMAIAVIGILPVLCIYPFFQKYFVKGIVVGGVKGGWKNGGTSKNS